MSFPFRFKLLNWTSYSPKLFLGGALPVFDRFKLLNMISGFEKLPCAVWLICAEYANFLYEYCTIILVTLAESGINPSYLKSYPRMVDGCFLEPFLPAIAFLYFAPGSA